MCVGSKPWKMRTEYADGSERTVSYGSERTANAAARWEMTFDNVVRCVVWDSRIFV